MWFCYYALLLPFSAFSWSFRDEKQKIWSFLWKKLRKDKDYAKNFVILRPILVVMSCRYWRMDSVTAHNSNDSPRRAMWGDAAITRRALGGKCESHDIIKGVFWRLVFDIQESRKFERYCQSKATKDVLGMCLYASPFWRFYMRHCIWGRLYPYRRGLLRCSFFNIGQCESLWMWDGRQGLFPRLLFVPLRIKRNSHFGDDASNESQWLKT